MGWAKQADGAGMFVEEDDIRVDGIDGYGVMEVRL